MAEQRVALITGAASGIGRAAAELFAERGCRVVAADMPSADLSWVGDRDDIIAVTGDASIEASNQAWVDAAMARWQRLDIAYFNAGVVGSPPIEGEGAIERFDAIQAVNVRGVVLGIRCAAPALRAGGGGAIVVTASTSGMGGDPGNWAYNASKAAAINLVRAAAIDYANDGIRVNAVAPGPTVTGMTQGLVANNEMNASMLRQIPMRRFGEAREQAEVAWFLASPGASFVTGVTVPCDGGVTASAGHFQPGVTREG